MRTASLVLPAIAALALTALGCSQAAEVAVEDSPPQSTLASSPTEPTPDTQDGAATASDPPRGIDPRGRLPVEDRQWTDRFDDHFRKYSKRFFSVAFDWRWFKAQGITESSLRADVESWVGAKGIMQIMPATFEEIAAKSSLPVTDSEDPGQNIAAGVFYDRHLYELWDDIPDWLQRLAFTLASYNGGRSRTLRAQDRCAADCTDWANVEHHVPEETRNYVTRIMGLMAVEP